MASKVSYVSDLLYETMKLRLLITTNLRFTSNVDVIIGMHISKLDVKQYAINPPLHT